MFRSGKTWGHETGLSCCFRQWKAVSHCRFLHGYALSVAVEFESTSLDEYQWVVDFGGLKEIKQFLVDNFDHKLIVAMDDPMKDELCALAGIGVADAIVLPNVGCERFAQYIGEHVGAWLHKKIREDKNVFSPWMNIRLHHVTVREHGANHASYYPQ